MAKKAYIGANNVARKIKKGYVGIENFTKRNLPAGYTQVEYIQSSGTQYIDTGFKPNQNTRVVLDVEAVGANDTKTVFGARIAWKETDFTFWFVTNTQVQSDYGNSVQVFDVDSIQKRLTIDKNKNVTTVGSYVVTDTENNFQSEFPMYLFAMNQNGAVDSRMITAKVYSCRIYDNGTLIRDYIPCTNSAGTAGLYDMVNGKFYTNAGTGTFAVGATYKGVARKIKKAYIGIGGVARPCWSGGELAYYGTVTSLGTKRGFLAATNVGNYALFGGGNTGSSDSTAVEAYNLSLTRSNTPTGLSDARAYLAATSVGNYALFGGGYSTVVDAYNSSLTRTVPSELYTRQQYLAATTVGGYALFGGGRSTSATSAVNAYDTSLTYKTGMTYLSVARQELSATTVGDYAIFAGGYRSSNSSVSNVADVYDKSLTKSTATALGTARCRLAATTVGDYAIFAGGNLKSGQVAVVDVYDKSLTKTTATNLSAARSELAATAINGFALFAGGLSDSNGGSHNTVDVYDVSLTRTVQTPLSEIKDELAATTLGDYALFGGGQWQQGGSDGTRSSVDAYTVA